MAKSRAGLDRTPKVEKKISETFEGHLWERSSAEPMVCPRFVSGWCMSNRKRCFDLVLSFLAIIVFLPLMLLIAWLIRLTSQGPALFRQERVGLHQQTFVIYKFRTMENRREPLHAGPTVTRHGDSRMTRIGALLRRLKLDELPQLINVVRGEMSFVGPRPKIPQHENLCMLCRPGITGAATIEFWTDLRILLHTIFKLSNGPDRTFSAESARFLVARASAEPASLGEVRSLENSDFSRREVRQSA